MPDLTKLLKYAKILFLLCSSRSPLMLFVNRLNSAILVGTALLPREGGEGGMGREEGQGTHDVPIHVCSEFF